MKKISEAFYPSDRYPWFDRWCKQFEGETLSGKRREIWEFIESERQLAQAEAREEVNKSRDDAYHERNLLVFALTTLFPSWRSLHEETDSSWERDWMNIIYVQLPTGQASWHIHDSELPLFEHLELKDNCWDGHNTERKYERVKAMKDLRSNFPPPQTNLPSNN